MVGVNGDSGKYSWTGSLGLYCIDSGVVLVLDEVLGSPLWFPKSRAAFLQYESCTVGLSLETSKVTLQAAAGLVAPFRDPMGSVCITLLPWGRSSMKPEVPG